MENKINLDKFVATKEEMYSKKQMDIYKKVIDEYINLTNIDFRSNPDLSNDDYKVFDFLLQITVAQPQFFEEFHKIISKYGFNDKTYLDYAIKKITFDATNLDAFLEGLINVGIIDEVYDVGDNSINLKSCMGTYNFFFANEYYGNNEEINSYIQNNYLKKECHTNTLFLLNCLKEGEAITALCHTEFNNPFYHSYYRKDGMISDLNINCVMNEKDYNAIYNPKIISVVNVDDFKEKQLDVKSKCNSTLYDLLEIAAYEEYKV